MLFFLLLLSGGTAYAQQLPMIHYTTDHGLPSNTVYYMHRDRQGFLWLCTDKGLTRYNGISFETFTTFDGLPDNEILFVMEDPYGRLWLATYNGELCFYRNGVFHSATNTPSLALPFKTSFTNNIVVEADSSVTIAFDNGDRLVNITGDKMEVLSMQNNIHKEQFRNIISREKIGPRSYKVVTIDETIYLDSTFNILKRDSLSYATFSGHTSLLWGRAFTQGQRYIYNEDRVFDADMNEVLSFRPDFKPSIRQIYNDDINYLIVTHDGLYIKDSINIFQAKGLSCVTRDRYGDYWVSTLENGIFKFSGSFASVKNTGIPASKVKWASACKGGICYATADNNVWWLSNDTARLMLTGNSYIKKNTFTKAGSYLVTRDTLYYCDNFNTTVIVGIPHHAAPRFYPSGTYPHLTFDKSLRSGVDFLINAKSCILKMKVQGETRFTYSVKTRADSRIFDLAKDVNGDVWYTAANGLYKMSATDGAPAQAFPQLALKAFGFYGSYVVGYTHHNQLVIARPASDRFVCDTVSSQNCIWGRPYKLDANHVLIATNKLYRLLTLEGDGRYAIWPVENDFLPSNADAIVTDSANCYFFSAGRVARYNISALYAKPMPPQLFYTKLVAGDSAYRISGNVSLNFRLAKNVKVLFSALSPTPYISYEYSVSEDGTDKWVAISSNEINLANIGFGNYVIKVRAHTLSSEYSFPIAFTLHILPPLWGRPWFIALALILIVILVGLFVRGLTRRALRLKEEKLEQQIANLRLEYKALNALMNPHFIFNTLNNVQSLFNQNKKLAANEYLRVFADLIRQNMDNISQEQIPLEKEIDLVKNYLALEKLRFDDRLEYSFNISDDLDTSAIMVAPLLIQPLVENSIKHGILPSERESGAIRINVYSKGETGIIEVADNGIGFAAASKLSTVSGHTSLGLTSIERRIKQLSIIQSSNISFHISEATDSNGISWTTGVISIPL